jgi:hypothetical protein
MRRGEGNAREEEELKVNLLEMELRGELHKLLAAARAEK